MNQVISVQARSPVGGTIYYSPGTIAYYRSVYRQDVPSGAPTLLWTGEQFQYPTCLVYWWRTQTIYMVTAGPTNGRIYTINPTTNAISLLLTFSPPNSNGLGTNYPVQAADHLGNLYFGASSGNWQADTWVGKLTPDYSWSVVLTRPGIAGGGNQGGAFEGGIGSAGGWLYWSDCQAIYSSQDGAAWSMIGQSPPLPYNQLGAASDTVGGSVYLGAGSASMNDVLITLRDGGVISSIVLGTEPAVYEGIGLVRYLYSGAPGASVQGDLYAFGWNAPWLGSDLASAVGPMVYRRTDGVWSAIGRVPAALCNYHTCPDQGVVSVAGQFYAILASQTGEEYPYGNYARLCRMDPSGSWVELAAYPNVYAGGYIPMCVVDNSRTPQEM